VYDHVFVSHLPPALTIFWNRLLPVMISRLMLSLRKASKVRENGWTSNALSRTHPKMITQIVFGVPPNGPDDSGGTTSEEVALSDLSGGPGRGGETTV